MSLNPFAPGGLLDLRSGRTLAAASGSLLAVPLLLSAGYAARETRRDLTRQPLAGKLVDVGGRQLHVRTAGLSHPGPTVLLEAGLGCPHDTWARIQAELARTMPTVSYDRAGLGGSDRGPLPRTAASMTDDLDRLLEAIGRPGPYLLVGHSFGGLLIRAFADRHPEQVAGIVLVDVSHPDQLRRSPGQREGMPMMRMQMRQHATLAALGFNRFTGRHLLTGIEALPPSDFERARARGLTSRAARAACDELDGWITHVNDEVRDTTLPDDCPLAVLTAGQVMARDPVHDELQQELAALSGRGIRRVVADADHFGLVMDVKYTPRVVEAVLDIAGQVREGRAGHAGGADKNPIKAHKETR